jgi:hypothetical protein
MLINSYGGLQDSELLKIWATRYIPDFTAISLDLNQTVINHLAEAISVSRRQAIASSILKNLITDCAFAGIGAQKICLQVDEGINLFEVKDIGIQIIAIYQKLLQLFVQEFVFSPMVEHIDGLDTVEGRIKAAESILPAFDHLSQAVEPLLQELQAIYLNSSNHRAIGFLTTQLSLTRQHVLKRLDIYSGAWLNSYFKLPEELVCMPWRRVCGAALRPEVSPFVLTMVQKLLPKSQAIARVVYQKALLKFPSHTSRQGQIQGQRAQASCLRDFGMFQAYIWLCVLEDSLSVVKEELLPLCLLVFPTAKVQWVFVECAVSWIVEEIQSFLDEEQLKLFSPYADRIQQLFITANPNGVDEGAIHQAMQELAARS